ncbi:hypothetical protein Acr_08g0017150 [Actinidia rufa]|uniref:acylphosphatase n=1 Tax=Actinidia rufa TaxID=165716 RepID=A0A7J0F526_9ERIC|nr:hypothetical protein Acr_08g0017150 [Actinidia rufa]
MASSTVTSLLPQSISKSQIFRNNRQLWNTTTGPKNVGNLPPPPRRLTLTPLLLPPHLRLGDRSLQIRPRSLLSHLPLPPLLRPRSRPLSPPMSSLADSHPTDTKTVRVVVKGRVQGVFYRNWTIENAKGLGLKGWVRNRRDGSVEALFSGSPDKVQEMEQLCRRGPPDAMVTALENP